MLTLLIIATAMGVIAIGYIAWVWRQAGADANDWEGYDDLN